MVFLNARFFMPLVVPSCQLIMSSVFGMEASNFHIQKLPSQYRSAWNIQYVGVSIEAAWVGLASFELAAFTGICNRLQQPVETGDLLRCMADFFLSDCTHLYVPAHPVTHALASLSLV